MNTALSLPPKDDIDAQMLKVARDLAMDMYPIEQILVNLDITAKEFHQWKTHPRFLAYLKTEREAWNSALNTHERTKLKASAIMEDYMIRAHSDLHDAKQPLNHRTELAKVVAKIAGMGEPKVIGGAGGMGGFNLQINIGPGVENRISITPETTKTIEYTDDGYDPFTSPNTLEDQ